MTEQEALIWIDQHCIYTMNWYSNNPYAGDLWAWDWLTIEWPCGCADHIMPYEVTDYVDTFEPW